MAKREALVSSRFARQVFEGVLPMVMHLELAMKATEMILSRGRR